MPGFLGAPDERTHDTIGENVNGEMAQRPAAIDRLVASEFYSKRVGLSLVERELLVSAST